MPQSVNALQSQYCEVKMCTITALWHSPRNANEAQVTGYRVFANGSFVTNQTIQSNTSNVNETRISSSILTIFPVPYCAAHMISVSAVNRCGREGKRSSILILDPENTLTLPVTCNPTDSAMRNDRCK